MTTTIHSSYCPTLGGDGECLACGASAIDDRTFRGFAHDIRPGDIVNIAGFPCTVDSVEHSTRHNIRGIRPTTIVRGTDRLGITRLEVIYSDDLIGITR